jgi:hypothetical protein
MHPALVSDGKDQIFYWNVDAVVGLNGVNAFDDVMFVQWCFYKMGNWPKLDPASRAVYQKTPVSGECSGRDDDALVASIRALQRVSHGAVVDGRVDPATTGTYAYHGGQHAYVIFYLNAALRLLHPEQYPRIDLMPEFIWRIRHKATQPFI